MDWNLLLCFVWINFVSIQAFSNFNNVDNKRLSNYLHRKQFQNLFLNVNPTKYPPRKNYDIGKNTYNQDGEPIYALVDMDIVIGRPYRPSTKKPLTYHGNEKWSMSRKSKDPIKKSDQDETGKNKKTKPALPPKLSLAQAMSSLSSSSASSSSSSSSSASYEQLLGKIKDSDVSHDKKLNPGNSLLQLNGKNLESAGKFSVPEKSSLVYGNLENLGISYGKTNKRLEFSNFRKSNNLVDLFESAIPKSKSGPKKWIIFEITPEDIRNPESNTQEYEENSASEIMDELSEEDEEDYRRKSHSKFRKREDYNTDGKSGSEESSSSSSESSSESGSSSEKNDGNPYTLFKGKYRQNWMWNHAMDGDHMNINPYGPLFHEMAATGQDLFFGRKWWYFNQDDYKPMG